MRVDIKGLVVLVKQTIDTLSCGQVAAIPSHNILVKLQPGRTTFERKQRWRIQLLSHCKMIFLKMIFAAVAVCFHRDLDYMVAYHEYCMPNARPISTGLPRVVSRFSPSRPTWAISNMAAKERSYIKDADKNVLISALIKEKAKESCNILVQGECMFFSAALKFNYDFFLTLSYVDFFLNKMLQFA